MSTAKRSHMRQADAGAASTLPPAKRAKFGRHTQEQPTSLAFLTDERQRAGKTIQAKPTNGIDTSRVDRVDSSKPAISGQVVDDSEDEAAASDAESVVSSSSEDPSLDSEVEAEVEVENRPTTNGTNKHDEDEEMEKAAAELDAEMAEPKSSRKTSKAAVLTNGASKDAEEADEDTGPSFGDMLQAAHPDVIDVAAAFNEPVASKALVPAENSKVLQAPSATSLGTVLTQALRTNDKDLLESCLQTKDLASIKSTIQRLQSPLVATLMQKLAERLHKRPGRAGPLMLWVQWSLVAHGGYLASQPQVVRKLRSLRQVVRERANSLQSLMTLKGKLDMLSAQVELRRGMRAQRAYQDESDEDEADVVYVEGVDNDDSSEEEENEELATQKSLPTRKRRSLAKEESGPASDVEMDGDVPLINGIDDDAEVESMAEVDEDDLDAPEGLIDDEAEESEGEESMSSEDDASGSESEEDEEEAEGSSSSDEEAVEEIPVSKQGRPMKRNALIRKR
ncbi:hypothetical protein B9Z65_8096 [Elsinoe australis]|uniref:Small-subunit processome Utp12 domain-containing protein n=1 Tax=Elsinoe australis TaxID=40998 RepID=A0A2P7YW17_9PEZI|nr:hypothetical protein B9Z65_8096 [Elsinoe australis]